LLSAVTINSGQSGSKNPAGSGVAARHFRIAIWKVANAAGSDRPVNNHLHACADSRIVPIQKIFRQRLVFKKKLNRFSAFLLHCKQ
jgi:hypothetical protein